MTEHPVLRTLLCAKCREFYGDGTFEQGEKLHYCQKYTKKNFHRQYCLVQETMQQICSADGVQMVEIYIAAPTAATLFVASA